MSKEFEFKVGDKIIGNHPTRYGITKLGWRGTVKKVNEDGTFNAVSEENVRETYAGLLPEYFDLVYPKVDALKKIVITTDGKTTKATLYGVSDKVSAVSECHPDDKFDFNVGAELAFKRLMKKVNPISVCGFNVGDRITWNDKVGTVICISDDYVANPKCCLGVEFDDKFRGGHSCDGVALAAGNVGKIGHCRWVITDDLSHYEDKPTYYNGKVVCVKNYLGNNAIWTVGKIYQFVNGLTTTDDGCTFPVAPKRPFTSFEAFNDWSTSEFIEVVE